MTNKSIIQVLVVDDAIDAANTFAALIEDTTGLSCHATNSPSEAVTVAEQNMVLVAVLDQRMPEKEGTQLFQDLRKVAPAIEAIMLTAEAQIGEISQGITLGFSQVLDKKEVEKLPGLVRNMYYSALAHISSRSLMNPVELVSERRRFWLMRTPSLRLVGFTVLEENYVNDHEWETYLQLTVGQKLTDEVQFKITHTFTLEQDSKLSMQARVGLKGLKALEAKLDSDLTLEVGLTDKRDNSLSCRTVVSYELPPRPADNSPYIQAINYQYAPTYRRVRLELERHCDACGSDERSVIVGLFATGRLATRHEEYSNSGDRQLKPTGFVRLENVKRMSGTA
jgi:CheY-like chemotaxis protein